MSEHVTKKTVRERYGAFARESASCCGPRIPDAAGKPILLKI